jgi:ABC-2 type transport system permease protein
MESLLTAPIGPTELVLGKLAPYLVVASGIVALVILAGGLIFGVWPRGSLFDLASFSLLFMLGMLALGLLISSGTPSQQTALMAATLSTMLPNIFLTGFAFPRSNMPLFLQWVSNALPATHFIHAIRGIFLKGVGWDVLWPQGLWMAATTAALLILSIRVVGKRMAQGLE